MSDTPMTVTDEQIDNYANSWALIHPEGDWWGEFTWMGGGTGDEPDWAAAEDGEWDEPTEIVAVRFTVMAWDGAPVFRREIRRRVFGAGPDDEDGEPHDFEFRPGPYPEGESALDHSECSRCGASLADKGPCPVRSD
jgi:hypothetical protein